MPKYVNIQKEQLIELYVKQKLSTKKIAEIFKCRRGTIENKLKKFDIPTNFRYDIPIDELKRLYINENKTSYDIAKIYGCYRKHIISRLKKIGISVKRHKREYSIYYEQKLTEEQKQIILGSLLGDGHICKHHEGENACRYIEVHAERQLPYLKWKMSKLDNFISKKEPRKINNENSKSFGITPTYSFMTALHKEFNYYHDMFYSSGKKQVPMFELTPLALAMWYYDDGSIDNRNNITLHTLSFDQVSINNLVTMLYRDCQLTGQVKLSKWTFNNEIRTGMRIYIKNKQFLQFKSIIGKYIIPSVEYKLKLSNNPVETQNNILEY